jgi:hypothetical protein
MRELVILVYLRWGHAAFAHLFLLESSARYLKRYGLDTSGDLVPSKRLDVLGIEDLTPTIGEVLSYIGLDVAEAQRNLWALDRLHRRMTQAPPRIGVIIYYIINCGTRLPPPTSTQLMDTMARTIDPTRPITTEGMNHDSWVALQWCMQPDTAALIEYLGITRI